MIDIDLQIQHHFGKQVYVKQMHLPAGHVAQSHKHTFDHLSILAVGNAVVEVDGVATTYSAGKCINIKANAVHSITALTDVVWFCIHATDITDPNQIDLTLIQGD